MYTQVVIWVEVILNHIDTRTILRRFEGSCKVYRPKWYQIQKYCQIPISYWYQKKEILMLGTQKKDNTRLTLVVTSNLGETKGRYLTFAKPWLYKKESHGRLLKALKMALSKGWLEIHFLYNQLLAYVKRLPFISPNLGVLTLLEHSLNSIKFQKWGQIPFLNMSS